MLLRIGGGENAQLSILRDTRRRHPRPRPRARSTPPTRTAARALAIKTVEQYLGIQINHLVEVNFDELPAAHRRARRHHLHGPLRALGASTAARPTAATRCGSSAARTHLNGKQALALARTRKNVCRPGEDDRDRVARQQKILAAMKAKVASLEHVLPAAVGLVVGAEGDPLRHGRPDAARRSSARSCSAAAAHKQVLKPSGFTTLPDGESAVQVSEADKRAAVARFLKG